MKPSFIHAHLDLLATVVLASFGLVAVLAPVEGWFKVAAAVPMALALPGYALAAFLFPPGALPAAERAVYAVSLSFAVTGLAGILVQLVVALDRQVWAALLFLLILAASIAAATRRNLQLERAPAPHPPLPRLEPWSALAIVVAAAIAALAVSIANEGARDEREAARFSELWVLTAERGSDDEKATSIGVSNHQGHPVSYRVRATHRGALVAEWSIRLADEQEWEASLPLPAVSPEAPLRVALLRGDRVVRRAFLRNRPDR